MFSGKRFLLVMTALALIAGGSFYAFKLRQANRAQTKPAVASFEPAIPDAPAMLLMSEETGELSRVITRDQSNEQITRIDVGYKDGRTGKYFFEKGKLRYYKAFNDNGKLFYEAEYEPSGFLLNYRFLRADGRTATSFQRQLDGSEELVFFDKDAYAKSSTITARDGSQVLSTRTDPSKKPELSFIKAEPNERNYLPLVLSDGSASWQLKVKLIGMRITEWEYRDDKGTLRHSGKFTDSGDVEITVLRPDGTPGYKQTWTCVGEDWSQRIYRLSSIEGFSESGVTVALVKLHADGKTPREITNFSSYNGQKNNVDYFNTEGLLIRQEYFYGGSSGGLFEVQPQFRRKAKLPALLTQEPAGSKGPVYRLKAMPYSTQSPQEGFSLSPLFILPN